MSGKKILFRLMALCLCLMLVLPLGMQAEAAACRYYSEGCQRLADCPYDGECPYNGECPYDGECPKAESCPRLESTDTEDFVPGCGRMARGRGQGNCPMYR